MADNYTERDYFDYTADDATHYETILWKWHGALTAWGFGAVDTTKKDIPHYLKPRVVYLYHSADGRRRVLSAGTTACDIWTGVATTEDLPDKHSATLVTFSVTNKRGERVRTPHAIH